MLKQSHQCDTIQEEMDIKEDSVTIKLLKRNLMMRECYSWSIEEDRKLYAWVTEKGINQWEKCSFLFMHKSPQMCRDRYHILFPKKKPVLCKVCLMKFKEKIKKKIMMDYYEFKYGNKISNDNSTEITKNLV